MREDRICVRVRAVRFHGPRSLLLHARDATLAASGTDELHQALIRDHFRRPRNRGALEAPAMSGRAHNRFCGDTVIMWARLEDGLIAEVTFDGRGCAISLAAASMLTSVARGRSAAEIADLRQTFVDGLAPDGPALPKEVGDLRALAGVRRFPSRVRCALLPFEALEEALRGCR
ncbi:MAG: SUF system NifU family Fe-S cluster assembly protein [Gemmatimonadetes bacterium]|nr:SUF system NifU family Fe-S cluster assembly protein [Gemmatimonadota bacterium]MCY3676243.1 SUF system NifU family Fe-S cluster assembly protein [Gemmatimonadota bacterium]MYA43473.1 SUF system NifU family Fe-S cluster assembly protein [Gemmatimonadota bacterium]MYE92702.1 SUF system NifU family Fe-S cluster assembly protein [Gemmatimonadota bacterium]MYJ10704.1 SUF system NifU family Fe-S cluster assembly protein [Gemmatimonadota bacterium]